MTDRKTVELCGHQLANGRCIRSRNHTGPHEALVVASDDRKTARERPGR